MLLTFFIGGGSREDIGSLVVLRPVAFLMCAVGILSLDRESVIQFRALFALAALVVVAVAIYLVPLPPAIWELAPGRDLIAQVDAAANLGPFWRPLSMDPLMTWNALFSLSVPFAILTLGTQIPRSRHLQIIGICIVVGLVSGVIGILQSVGPERGPLYFYRVTNFGAAVGLFSNRNHHAIFLAMLLPMLAVYAAAKVDTPEQRNRRFAFVLISGMAIMFFILNTGSRNGLVVGVLGALAAWRLFDPEPIERAPRRKTQRVPSRSISFAAGAAVFALLVFIVLRGQSFQRLIDGDVQREFRLQVWEPVIDMGQRFFPFGSGPGAFALPYQAIEPTRLLGTNYLNHAHNDWIEVPATMGIVGIAVLAVALALIIPRMLSALMKGRSKDERRLAALGAANCVLVGASSLVEYPLRSPSIMALFVLSLIWLWAPRVTEVDQRPRE